MFRLFVGLAIPPDIRQQLGAICSGLPGARWMEDETLHLTLRFIGEVDGAMADDVHDALTRLAAPMFTLAIAGLGCFDQSGKVHTLFATVEKQQRLSHLRDKVESALVRAGLEPERRKFKPHITLARFRNDVPERFAAYLLTHSRFATDPFLVDRFTLFRSHLSSSGPHYETLAEYALNTGDRAEIVAGGAT
jgi:2'-5' RNA ligase